MNDPIVGIDLGTSNTVVAYAESGRARVLADDGGYKIHPSVVSFHPNGGVVVGAAAKQRKVIDPKNTIYSVKRLIGRRFESPEVEIAQQRSPFPIEEGPNHQPLVVTRAGKYAVPEVSAIVLDHVRNVAAAALGREVNRAVVTVPASFNDAQRSGTATAGAIANLSVVRVINEPTAAALAYGHTRGLHEVIAVYDFGGGTFDITILRLADEVYEVLGTAGDTFLGGDDLDERLVDRMVSKFLTETRVDLRGDETAMMRLRAVAEQVKIELSRRTRAQVKVDEIAYGPKGRPLDLQIEIARDEFVREIADLVDRTFPVCEEALKFAQLDVRAIDDVVLVGGTTKIPYVRDEVTKFFGKAPRTDVNPEEAVALGAALQASALEQTLTRSPSVTVDKALELEDVLDEPTRDDYGEEPTAEQPKRPTAGYSEVMRSTAPGDRLPERGKHHDRIEAKPAGQAIGRITKSGPPPVPHKTMIGAAAVPAKPMAGTSSGPTQTARPMDAVRPPAIPAPPPRVPPAPPEAKTIMLEPEPQQPTVVVPQPVEPSPASTAKGFAPPQTYPVMQSPVVLDVTPRGLGIGTVAGYCEELIRRNSRVPAETRKIFTTGRDRQASVRIVVVQGESRRLEGNMVLGDLTLSDLPPRPRGETSIEVTFHIDASGILQVKARDAQTGREQRASLDLVGAMPEADIAASRDRMAALRR